MKESKDQLNPKPKPKQDMPILTDSELRRMLGRFSEGDMQAIRKSVLEKRKTGERLNDLERICQEMDNEEAREDSSDWSRGF